VIAAIVPVKRLAQGKSRLAGALGRDGAERLALAMLEDVVAALRGACGVDVVAVVTPDRAVADAAEKAGARALLEQELEQSESGERTRGLASGESRLNDAIDRAARALAAEATLVVLGDVAGATSEDLGALVAAIGGRAPIAAIAPSRDGGTAALARRPHAAFASRFGADSANAHRAAAGAAGVPCAEHALPSLALDLDDPDDLRAFLATREGGAHTRALLRELGVGAER
jgi:2-phospho-L-lactate/phosphoenolpyruvate guanylyltransferase